jgi:hypothetical protein
MARTRKPKPPPCPVEAFARAVVTGQVVAGRLVRLACQRHLDNLSSGKQRGLIWDGAAARHTINFFGHLRHSTGEWAHQPFVLQPWQGFVIGSLFGWKRADGLRRFRTAYVEVARKNGKSVMLAGTALYALVAELLSLLPSRCWRGIAELCRRQAAYLDAISRIQAAGIPLKFITNTTRGSRRDGTSSGVGRYLHARSYRSGLSRR